MSLLNCSYTHFSSATFKRVSGATVGIIYCSLSEVIYLFNQHVAEGTYIVQERCFLLQLAFILNNGFQMR